MEQLVCLDVLVLMGFLVPLVLLVVLENGASLEALVHEDQLVIEAHLVPVVVLAVLVAQVLKVTVGPQDLLAGRASQVRILVYLHNSGHR